MSADHPLHPATVHWPIAFYSLAWGLDALYGATTKLQLPFLTSRFASSVTDISRASHYLQILGILTALPSIASGSQQLIKMIGNGGMYEADNQTLRPKVKLTLLHAAMNDVVLVASLYCWWVRRDAPGFAPSGLNVLASVGMLLPMLFFSANLGGTLVYNYGVGLAMGKKSKGQ